MEKKIIKLQHTVCYNDCGCTEIRHLEIDTEHLDFDIINQYYKEGDEGIKGKCPKCIEFDKQHHMVREVWRGDYDWKQVIYVFETQNIREVVRYCWAKEIPLHDQFFHITTPWDCSGELHTIYTTVTRGKKYITVINKFLYDL